MQELWRVGADHLESFLVSPRMRQRYLGRWGGIKGAADGIEAGRAKGGRTRKWASDDQEQGQLQQHVLALHDQGLSTRDIAERVFGDRRLYLRVWRLLNS
jgi:hypothetical protein